MKKRARRVLTAAERDMFNGWLWSMKYRDVAHPARPLQLQAALGMAAGSGADMPAVRDALLGAVSAFVYGFMPAQQAQSKKLLAEFRESGECVRLLLKRAERLARDIRKHNARALQPTSDDAEKLADDLAVAIRVQLSPDVRPSRPGPRPALRASVIRELQAAGVSEPIARQLWRLLAQMRPFRDLHENIRAQQKAQRERAASLPESPTAF